MRVLPVLCAVAVAFLVASCGKKEEKNVTVSTPEGNVSVSSGGGQVTMQSDNGKSSVTIASNGSASAASVPSYVSVYPGAKVTSTVIGAGGGNGGGMVIYTTDASPDAVIAFHKKQAEGAGLKQTVDMNMQGTLTYAATDEKTKHSMQVTVTKADGGMTQAEAVWSSGGN